MWWVATLEPESKGIPRMSISKEQNMFVAIERFISDVVEEHGEHLVSTEMLEHSILHHKPVNF
jgi:hypothetical protein